MKIIFVTIFNYHQAFDFKNLCLIISITFCLSTVAQTPSANNTLGSSGLTSIASTTNASFKLSVNGTVKHYGTGNGTGAAATLVTSPSIYLANTTASTGRQFLINSDNSGLFRISDAVGTTSITATDRFVINPTGLIGIGNSTPTSRLHITGAGSTSATSSLLIQNSSNTNLLIVQDDGKVGIGVLAPTQALDILGNININATNTAPVNIFTNYYQNPQVQISNTFNASGAGCGYAAFNNLSHTLQMSIASASNAYIPDGSWVRSDGTGGLSLVVNGGGPIAFTPSLTLGSSLEWGRFSPAGNFGLGLKTPSEKLDVLGNIKFSGALMPANSAGIGGQILTSGGPGLAPSWTNPSVSYWAASGNDIYKTNSGNVGIGTSTPQYLLDINGTARVINQMIIGSDTYVIPSQYRLAVRDGIITERLKIRLRVNWPDFVLHSDYNLPSINEVEKYILTYAHLPGIQSAEDVKLNGIEIGELTAKLIQKIEELTLYIIHSDKQIKALQKEVRKLK